MQCGQAFSIHQKNEPIPLHTSDEFGDLADALNIIAEDLNNFDDYQRAFISNISHDFRSPLTSIHGYAQAMLDGTIPYEAQEKYLNIILSETDRLTNLTSNLLELNSFNGDNVLLDITTFNICETIVQTVNTLEGTAAKKKFRLFWIIIPRKNCLWKQTKARYIRCYITLLTMR